MPLSLAGFQIHRRTMLSPNSPFPGRWPPYPPCGKFHGYERHSQVRIGAHLPQTLALPVVSAESFSQVSCPNSPGRGIVRRSTNAYQCGRRTLGGIVDVGVFHLRRPRSPVSRTDDHYTASPPQASHAAQLPGFEIDFLIVVQFQIDDSAAAEGGGNRNAGLVSLSAIRR